MTFATNAVAVALSVSLMTKATLSSITRRRASSSMWKLANAISMRIASTHANDVAVSTSGRLLLIRFCQKDALMHDDFAPGDAKSRSYKKNVRAA